MKRTLLIADDSDVNRRILCKILSEEFEVLQAENGQQALEQIERSASFLSAVILDIGMPVLDGFGVLEALKEREEYRNLPILIATGNNDRKNEIKALGLGAWDFIAKPYDIQIIRFRLHNAIERSKLNLFEQLKKQAETDPLTGLYNEAKFTQRVRSMLDAHPERTYYLVRFDVDRFKQFNALFGTDEGNRFLCYVAKMLRDLRLRYPPLVFARLDSDVFVVCWRDVEEAQLREEIERFQAGVKRYTTRFDVVSAFGVYPVTDCSLSVTDMIGRATMAARTCKGKYLQNVAFYDEEMGRAAEREQLIVNEMNSALEQEQFCVYFQPKYNIATSRPIGAEALVRWRHPERGLISPGLFIPVLEKNGFIAKVDYSVWEQTCRCLRRWTDQGLTPDPVSVNLSRVNLSNPRIVEIVTELVRKYDLPPRLLQMEITESAYMDNPDTIDQTVERFHQNGFTVLMDDFGSGYSSLNTLKDISVDILKIDMKFLPTGKNNTKGEKILASMIRMADWIGMPVVMEGVETPQQRDFLESIGCLYVQGFLYGRPMPADEYEALIARTLEPPDVVEEERAGLAALDGLLSSDSATETLLRSIAVPVAIYQFDGGHYDRLRANSSFFATFGHKGGASGQDAPESLTPLRVSPNEDEKVRAAFSHAVATQSAAGCETLFILEDGSVRWYRLSIRYIMASGGGSLLSCVFTEITQAKRVENELNKIVGILNRTLAQSKRTMMVVDDSDVSRMLLKTIFGAEFHILEAANGREALTLLHAHTDELSVILLDMMMPEMTGAEFLAFKSRMDAAARIPVVVISADDSEHLQVDMLRSGVNDYVTKPFVPEVVYQRVHNVLEYQSRFETLVREYRQALSLSPEVGPKLTDSVMSSEEARVLISFMTPIFDVVRIVDPDETAVITFDSDGELHKQPYTCFRVWNKETRCENCVSACASRQNCQLSKYEFIENNIFYVVSKPITLALDDERRLKVVLEIVSHVSDSLLSQSVGGVPMRQILEDTRRQIYCDPLTDAFNRRYLEELLFLHRGRADSTAKVAFIMLDMNGFKGVNDRFGHVTGDRVLTDVAAALKGQVRQTDSVVRYGGDEFLVILTGCDEPLVGQMAERLTAAVAEVVVSGDERASAKYGCSYTADFRPSRDCLENCVRLADQQMYLNRR